MYVLLWAMLALAAAHPQATLSEPELMRKLEEIFGKNPNLDPDKKDPSGDYCQCVPYYMCDSEGNAAYLADPSLSGFGMLDIRTISENPVCQESIEKCCKILKIDKAVKQLDPDSSRLKGCGYRNTNGLDFTLTGGKGNEAQFGEFPWVVAVLDARNNSYYGVGALIHPQVVITAAHVVHRFKAGGLKIRAGEWDTLTTRERLPHQERDVAEIRVHDDFIKSNVHNDIALLRLAANVAPADHIDMACMPEQDEELDGARGCVANGWGKRHFGRKGRFAEILKKVELDVLDSKRCQQRLRSTRLGNFFKLHDSFVCAAGSDDTCEGDGGAPLMCPSDDRYKLSGLVSWGIDCGMKNVPGVYTRVPAFRYWVDAIVTSWGLDTRAYDISVKRHL